MHLAYRPIVYGKIQMWKRDVLYVATRVLSGLYIAACARHISDIKHSIFIPRLNFARLQSCMSSSPFWGVYMPLVPLKCLVVQSIF